MKTVKSNLKIEAERIVDNLGLITMLSKYGHTEIVGSVALDLIVKKDIDIHVFLESGDFLKIVNEVSNELIEKPEIDEVRISDWREIRSMKISVDDFKSDSGLWDIEIWLTKSKDSCGFDFLDKLRRELTKPKRKIIMDLKQHFYDKGLLKDSMSRQIYLAVVDHGITTLDEFYKYLESQKDD